MSNVKLFESRKVRTHWDEKTKQWYFSVIDVIEALTDSSNPRDYWFKMKNRVKTEDGLELSTICRQLKLKASDCKMRNRCSECTYFTEDYPIYPIAQSRTFQAMVSPSWL